MVVLVKMLVLKKVEGLLMVMEQIIIGVLEILRVFLKTWVFLEAMELLIISLKILAQLEFLALLEVFKMMVFIEMVHQVSWHL